MRDRRWKRLLGAPMATMVLAAPVAPPTVVEDANHVVGQTVERVGSSLPKLPAAPLGQKAPRPAPAPKQPAAPRPAASTPRPVSATGRSAATAAAKRTPATRPAPAPRARSSAVPSKASGGTAAPSDPTDEAQAGNAAAGRAAPRAAAASADPASLPFTGATLVAILLPGVLLVLAGIGLRRAVRVGT